MLTLLCVADSTTPCNGVDCLVDPCSVTTCSAYPTATCTPNYCGGCNADFFDTSGANVTALCDSVATTTTACNTVNCLVDPCMFATCSAYPAAVCISNYCGGCNAEFFNAGTDVTVLCDTIATTVSPPLSCPPPGPGLCVEACSPDTVCPSGQLCCSNGCGHQCVEGIAATQSKMTSMHCHRSMPLARYTMRSHDIHISQFM